MLHEIDPIQLKQWLDASEAILIDVREPEEYRAEFIPAARNVPLSTITANAADFAKYKGKKVVVHCQLGKRGQRACEQLERLAVCGDVWNLKGGITAWKEAHLPTVCQSTSSISLQRQVQITVGAITLIGVILGVSVNAWWLLLPTITSLGLLNAGISGWCGMQQLIGKMPWNKP